MPVSESSVLLVGNFVPASASYGSVSQELAERLEQTGWRVVRTSYRQHKLLKAMDMLRVCWTERHRYGVAHVEVYSGKAFLWAEAVCALLRRLGKPFVLGLHGGNLPVFLGQRPRRGRRLLASASAVVSPSPYLKNAFARWRPDVQLMPNALDLGVYPARLRHRPGPKLIWLRAFRQMYAPEVAVGALAELVPQFPDATLTMIGPDRRDGSLERSMELARRRGVWDRVRFIPGVPKRAVGAYLDQADIFVNTSTIDNTPVSVIEALCSGLCVVSTQVGGIRHLLDNGRDSLLVPPNDTAALAGAIGRILCDHQLAARLSHNALEKARDFDWNVVLPRWHRLLRAAGANLS